jgi:hypothetical protein
MPRKIKDVTKDYLVGVPLPTHGSTYTVISHQSIIDYAYQELANQGFGIVGEEYRCTHDGQIAQGIYKLQFNSDPEMSIMFAWTNSYNKQIKFKCATGAYVHVNDTVMLPGEIGTYARKHTGSADTDTIASMQSQITNAMMYYNQLVLDKDAMKSITISSRKQAELLGVLFAEYEILTTEQASMVKQQMDKPSYFYNGGKDTLWAFYNHVTVALQQSHPRTWMEDQRMLHWIITNEFDLSTPIPVAAMMDTTVEVDPLYVVPNQTNILDQIAECNKEEAIELDSIPEGLIVPSIATAEEQDAISEQIIIQADVEEEILDLDAEEEEDWSQLEAAGVITPIVQYTDPAGNTFEAPIVEEVESKFEWEKPELEESNHAVMTNDFDFDLGSDDEEVKSSDLPDFF